MSFPPVDNLPPPPSIPPLSDFLPPDAPPNPAPAVSPSADKRGEEEDPFHEPPLEILEAPELTEPPPRIHTRPHPRLVPRHFGPSPGRLRALAAAALASPSPILSRLSESLSELHARATTSAATVIINELLHAEEIALWHGLPRAGKSMLLLRACLDLALGDAPVWGDPRFSIAHPYRVLYFTEEDGPGLVDSRVSSLLLGRAIDSAPRTGSEISNLRVIIRKGISFDRPDTQGQSTIIREIVAHSAEVVAFDPLRSFTEKCDQGPSQLAPVTFFLRKILRDTSCRAIIVGHHDVKPSRDGLETRGRAHRASGGGIFSIADSPINFERASDSSPVYCFPTLFKGRAQTPGAFSVRFETPAPNALAFHISPASAYNPHDDAIVDFVSRNPGCTVRMVRAGVVGDGGTTNTRLSQLVKSGAIVQLLGPRRARFNYLPADVPEKFLDSSPCNTDELPPED